jgi:hypothetical protein
MIIITLDRVQVLVNSEIDGILLLDGFSWSKNFCNN